MVALFSSEKSTQFVFSNALITKWVWFFFACSPTIPREVLQSCLSAAHCEQQQRWRVLSNLMVKTF